MSLARPLSPGLARSCWLTSRGAGQFAADVEAHLPADGKGVAFASAWLATDNAIVALFKQATPSVFEGMSLVGVDTLHLFPTTYDVQAAVEAKYGKDAHVTKPLGCETTEDFTATYGHCEELHHGDFDMHSKVEPFKRALGEVGREILVTVSRRPQPCGPRARIVRGFWFPHRPFVPCRG